MGSSPCGTCGTTGAATTTMLRQRMNYEGRRHIYLPIRFFIPSCSRTGYEQENWRLHLDGRQPLPYRIMEGLPVIRSQSSIRRASSLNAVRLLGTNQWRPVTQWRLQLSIAL